MENPFHLPLPALEALENIGRELQCSICRDVFSTDTVKLPCCHYFCRGCIREAFKVNPFCPECKQPFKGIREAVQDEKIERIAGYYMELEALTGRTVLCSQQQPLPSPVRREGAQRLVKAATAQKALGSEKENQDPAKSTPAAASCDAGGRGMPSTIAGAVTETTARGKQEGGPTASAVSPVRAAPPATAAAAPPGPSRLPVVTCTPGEDSEDVAARRGDASREPAPLPDGTSGNARPEANSDPYAYMGSEATPAAAKRTSRICSARTAAAKAPSKSTPGAIPRTPPTRAAEGAGGSGTRDDEDGAPTVRRGSMRNLKWTCGVCTMENEPAKRKCAVCKAPRGADTVPEEIVHRQETLAKALTAGGHPSPSTTQERAASQQGAKRGREAGGSHTSTPSRPPKKAKTAAARTPGASPAHTARKSEERHGRGLSDAAVASHGTPAGGRRTKPKDAAARGAEMGTETQGAAEGLNLLVLGESDAEGARASLAGERKQGGTTGERKREKKRKSAGKGAAEGAASSEKGCWVAARNWVVTGSSLNAAGRKALDVLAKRSGCVVADQWADGVTHVVCGVDKGAAKRTAKYVLGIQSGAWVVTPEWVKACNKVGAPVDESQYLVQEDADGARGAAEKARGGPGPQPVLEGRQVCVLGGFQTGDVMSRNVERLVAQGGGSMLLRVPEGANAAGVVVIFDPEAIKPRELSTGKKLQEAGASVVGYRWLFASIVEGKLADATPFSL